MCTELESYEYNQYGKCAYRSWHLVIIYYINGYRNMLWLKNNKNDLWWNCTLRTNQFADITCDFKLEQHCAARNILFHICWLFFHLILDIPCYLSQAESLTRAQQEREAGEAKSLWEAEVRARNKLGAKVRKASFLFFNSKVFCFCFLSRFLGF